MKYLLINIIYNNTPINIPIKIYNLNSPLLNIKIENNVVKRKCSLPKTTLFLDSNFEISILGGQDKMVQGFDEAAGLHYYNLYYQKEK